MEEREKQRAWERDRFGLGFKVARREGRSPGQGKVEEMGEQIELGGGLLFTLMLTESDRL